MRVCECDNSLLCSVCVQESTWQTYWRQRKVTRTFWSATAKSWLISARGVKWPKLQERSSSTRTSRTASEWNMTSGWGFLPVLSFFSYILYLYYYYIYTNVFNCLCVCLFCRGFLRIWTLWATWVTKSFLITCSINLYRSSHGTANSLQDLWVKVFMPVIKTNSTYKWIKTRILCYPNNE